ncbi:NAD+ synthase [Nitrososphaera viennensis]|uniref:NH(3)-dependent NAD(+) synthetase n=1 Tax=Nitrososphaera viennensis TaxID=1034015 RepID=A0A977ICD7_9ARCH|nr:NAD+ synthase [Nitrososphaera viennensis]UVS68216.1 NAD+ synthase [Nitrososphaera viennensis]
MNYSSSPESRVLARLTGGGFDRAKTAKSIEKFIAGYVKAARAEGGVVVGLSGGLDSAVVAALCARALGGSGRVLGLILPGASTPNEDVEDAAAHARELGIEHQTINIEPIVERCMQVLPDIDNKVARGNLTARVRMSVLYYHAYVGRRLVAGTSDKSEISIGYFTKFGDGGADMIPIAGLYKTQVRELGRYLKVPGAILQKKSSPRLWADHTAEDEIGMSYETIDPILYMLVDRKKTAKEAAAALGVPIDTVKRVQAMVVKSAHKRAMPAAPPRL